MESFSFRHFMLRKIGVIFYVGTLTRLAHGDPDFDSNDKDHISSNNNVEGQDKEDEEYDLSATTTYYVWTGAMIGILFFVVLLCLLASFIYHCLTKSRRNPTSAAGQMSQQGNDPKVFVLHPPSYVSAEPPSYNAPDYFNQPTAKGLNQDKNKKKKKTSPNNIIRTAQHYDNPACDDITPPSYLQSENRTAITATGAPSNGVHIQNPHLHSDCTCHAVAPPPYSQETIVQVSLSTDIQPLDCSRNNIVQTSNSTGSSVLDVNDRTRNRDSVCITGSTDSDIIEVTCL